MKLQMPYPTLLWRMLAFLLVSALLLAACGTNSGSNSTSVSPTLTVQSILVPDNSVLTPVVTLSSATESVPATGSTNTASATPAVDSTQAAATPTTTSTQTAAATQTTAPQTVTNFPDPSGFAWEKVVSGLQKPLDLKSPQDNSGRLFIVNQPGSILILQDGQLLQTPFLDISKRVGSSGTEQGLLGLAFHPNYAQNGYFYVNYTDRNGDTVIARYQVSADDPNRADPNSEKVLLTVDQPYPNHNGGGMMFGPDGYLYMSLGDGGSANDPHSNGQSLDTYLGKLLRVNVDQGDPYAIPSDNPFANGGGLPEIWAYGLRNPWRFSLDRATGDLYIADVGQNTWEEVDFQPAGAPGGANFGWNYREGAHPFRGTPPADLNLIDPVTEYQHPVGCSITGGYVYRGQDLPEFQGIYLYSDFCSGIVWGLLRMPDGSWQSQELFRTGFNVSSFGLDQAGEIYMMDQPTGTLYRLQRK